MADLAALRPIDGSCHCGNIRFTFFWPGPAAAIPVRTCSCSFCLKHGGVYTSHPKGRLEVRISEPSRVTRYRFGTQTAEFHICQGCGVVPLVTSTIEGTVYAVVNVNSFEGVDPSELDRSVTDFGGETPDSRLTRRQRNWIANVKFE